LTQSCRLSALKLTIAAASLVSITARAEADTSATDSDASSLQKGARASAAQIPSYHIERVGNEGIKLVSNNAENNYAITLSGSNADGEPGHGSLLAGEEWQRSLGVEVEGKLGSVLTTELQSHFTQAERTPDAELFGLQMLDSNGSDRRALGEFTFKTQFLGNRITVNSSRLESNLEPLGSVARSKGASEKDGFSAWIWRSDHSGLSVDGTLTRVDADYQDLTGMHTAEMLQLSNKQIRQVQSKLDIDRVSVFLKQRGTSTLAPDRQGDRPDQSETETGVSFGLSDLRQLGSGSLVAAVLPLVPDSVWISTDTGTVETNGALPTARGQLEKMAVGTTRSLDIGTVSISYWESAVQNPALQGTDNALWRGHGTDIAGNLYSGRWSISGNLSLYGASNTALSGNSTENSLNASVFVNWKPQRWPSLSAGMTNYTDETAFFDYNGAEQSGLIHYQFAVDFSPLVAAAFSDKNSQLTFLTSFQGEGSRSRWGAADYANGTGNVFVGLKFARPFLP